MTTDDKYSLLSRCNSMQTMHMHLSEKQKKFSEYFCAFLKSAGNSEHFTIKDNPCRFCISGNADPERLDQVNI